MSISAISGNTYNPYQAGSLYQPQIQQLSKDLQSGDLSAAQSDFAALQQAFSQPTAPSAPSSSPVSTAIPIGQALSQLGADLQGGNLSAAQKDFSTLQQDLQNLGAQVRDHFHSRHHFGGGGGGGGLSTLLQGLSQTNQTSSTSDLAAAQQSYASLQQQLQQFTSGRGALASNAAALQEEPLSLVA